MKSLANPRAGLLSGLLMILFGAAVPWLAASDAGNDMKKTLGAFFDQALANAAKKSNPTQPVALTADGAGGLTAEYFDNRELKGPAKLTRRDAQVAFDWNRGAPVLGLPADNFSVRWTGMVRPRYSESYVFFGRRDDGLRVWLEGRLILDLWNENASEFASAPVELIANRKYDLKVEFFESAGKAGVDLRWKSPSQRGEAIPSACLFLPGRADEPSTVGSRVALPSEMTHTIVRAVTPTTIVPLNQPGTKRPAVPVRFESHNSPGHFIRHYHFKLQADPNVSPVEDSQFKIVAGLADPNGVSFESVNFPGQFIRQSNYEVWLNQNDSTATFAQDATFRMVAGLADSRRISFQSYKFPTRYLRHLNPQLRLDPIDSDTAKQDATWQPSETVDIGAKSPLASGHGLRGEYFDNRELRGPAKITRIDPMINFDWGSGPAGAGLPDDNFSARWTGQIQPRFSESYVFSGMRDNGFRLWVDGQLLVDLWNNEWGAYESRPIMLQANRRSDIKIEYYEDYGGTAVSLKWKSASQAEEVVSADCLYPPAIGPTELQPRPPVINPGSTKESGGKFDRTQWFATRGSWNNRFGEGSAYDDSAIEIDGPVITLKADRTDQVAALYSRPFALSPGDILSIKRSLFVHAASRKFEACLTAYAVDEAGLNANKPAYQDSLFNVGYRNSDDGTDQNLFCLSDGKSYPPGPGKFAGGTAPTTAPIWDQWFDEELRYHSGTGETVYSINGRECLRYRAAPLTKPYVKLLLHPYGWGTGHYLKMKSIEISVSSRGAGDGGGKPDADFRARLLATPYAWADNGTTLGTIAFAADGSAKASWSGDIHYWRIDGGELVISANGTTYVTRLVYAPGDGRFSGARDRTSRVQDGVKTTLQPLGDPWSRDSGGAEGSGLRGEYFGNPELRGPPKFGRVDYGITNLWGDDSPGPGVPADNFSVRWTGEIKPRHSENYVFSGYRDDGVRIWIDDRLIVDEWKEGNWAPFASAPVLLAANRRHKIRVEYLEMQGQARFDLHWRSPSQREERIPATCLYPASASGGGLPPAGSTDQLSWSRPGPLTGGDAPLLSSLIDLQPMRQRDPAGSAALFSEREVARYRVLFQRQPDMLPALAAALASARVTFPPQGKAPAQRAETAEAVCEMDGSSFAVSLIKENGQWKLKSI